MASKTPRSVKHVKNIEVSGIPQAIKDMRSYVRKKHQELVLTVLTSSMSMQEEAKKLAPKDLGELKNNITHVLKTKGSRLKGNIESDIISAAPYSAYVEFGARPHWTKISNIQGWADRHGIPAGAVQYSIATKGTKAQPFMDPAYRKEKPKFINGVKRVMSAP